jgi:RNA polymerase sigma-70 factor (ECF subfamily)
MDLVTDEQVADAITGSREGIECLVADLWPRAFRIAFAFCGDSSIAEEATQNACLACALHVHRLRKVESFKVWFTKILLRAVAKERRRMRAHYNSLNRHAPIEPSHENVVLVLNAISLLQKPFREAIVLTALLGYSSGEAADILRIPAGTVRYRVHRARVKLAEELGESFRHYDATDETVGVGAYETL